MKKREHWGACIVRRTPEGRPFPVYAGAYPTMEGAIEALDQFNWRVYWPLHNVIPYLEDYAREMGHE
jgi:hypothetical protein